MSVTTKNNVFHTASSRGFVDHGWLISHHTFSFASYHNPDRVNFGALRVLNDDGSLSNFLLFSQWDYLA